MAVADDALTEIFDVAILLSHQGAPGGFPSPACPSSRSPTAPAWCGSSPLAPRPADHSADRPADIRRIVRLACHLPNQAAWDEPRIRFEYELGHQSQGGEGTRPGYPVNAARPRRRGDRITLFAAVQEPGPQSFGRAVISRLLSRAPLGRPRRSGPRSCGVSLIRSRDQFLGFVTYVTFRNAKGVCYAPSQPGSNLGKYMSRFGWGDAHAQRQCGG